MSLRLAAALAALIGCTPASAAPYHGHCRHGHCVSSGGTLREAIEVALPSDMRAAVAAVRKVEARAMLYPTLMINAGPWARPPALFLQANSLAEWRLVRDTQFDAWSERVRGAFSRPAAERGRMPRNDEGD